MKTFSAVATIGMLALFGTGCARSLSGEVYSRDQAQKAQTLRMGTVEAVKLVQIEGTKSPVGAIAGGAMGAALGSTIGGGSGQTVATVAGGIAGAAAGAKIEEEVTKQQGVEITLRMDSGETIVVVQAADVSFQPGERVRVVASPDGTTRVAKP